MFVSLIISPTSYIICLIILGWLLKAKAVKRLCYALAGALFLLFSNAPLYQYVAEKWYEEYDHPLQEGKTYTYGIVLGGYSYWDWERGRVEFSNIADRLTEGIRLYKTGRIRKLVLASDGSIIQSADGKGLQGNPQGMMKYLESLGIPSEDIIMETRANSTWENATFTKELIGEDLEREPSLLITSAIHMRRALLAFNSVGLYPDSYLTDTFVDLKGVKKDYTPSLFVLASWQEMTHELVGYVVYNYRIAHLANNSKI